MSNLLFTNLPVEQQEIIVGGSDSDSGINSVTGNTNTIPDAVNSSLSNLFDVNNFLGSMDGLLTNFIPNSVPLV
ncbi:hypothetical protein [Trichormus sp. NMC-1]|uniref:hypothetical protein n=1 Tax=Trichormus sp. NMC-1 TaxID=1853259 RepID=UPI0008DC26D0|nr:hypothetical protein [Trichormus sp. NMC-1]